jgi:hypothetical protein
LAFAALSVDFLGPSAAYSAGSSAVNGEQHGFSVAWKFINSRRIPSGS